MKGCGQELLAVEQLAHLSPLAVPFSPPCVSPAFQPGTNHGSRHIFRQVWAFGSSFQATGWIFSEVSPAVFLQHICTGGEFGQQTEAYPIYLELAAIILHLPFGRTFYKTFAFPQPYSS